MANLDTLVNRCILFTDRMGVVLGKDSHPFGSWLSMEYKSTDLFISFRVQNSPYSNGSSYVKVNYKGKTVLEAEGSFMALAFNSKAKTNVPGDWETMIPLYDEILKRSR